MSDVVEIPWKPGCLGGVTGGYERRRGQSLQSAFPSKTLTLAARHGFSHVHLQSADRRREKSMCEEIHSREARKMSQLLSEAKIVREGLLGLTKSLIAIWQANGPAHSARSRGPH